MSDQHTYTIRLGWQGNKRGTLMADKRPDISFSPPVNFGGPETEWTPEDFLVAALGSCYLLNLMSLKEKMRLEFELNDLAVDGLLTKPDGKSFAILEYVVRPTLTIDRDSEEKIRALLEKTAHFCLISASLKGEKKVVPTFQYR